ncbi:MAG: ankyrin repeat domain-containing protein [Acidimicrobiales bacterium]
MSLQLLDLPIEVLNHILSFLPAPFLNFHIICKTLCISAMLVFKPTGGDLVHAISSKKHDVVSRILNNNISGITKYELNNALFLAIEKNLPQVVELLTKPRADLPPIVSPLTCNSAPMCIAANIGNPEILAILQREPKFNLQAFNNTGIITAIKHNNIAIVSQILSANVIDINAQHGAMLRTACNYNRTDIIKLLLQQPNINISFYDNEALCLAIKNNSIDVFDLLIAKYAQPPPITEMFMRYYIDSLGMGITYMVESLLTRSYADISYNYKCTILQIALANNYDNLSKILISDSSIDLSQNENEFLHTAATNNASVEIFNLLMSDSKVVNKAVKWSHTNHSVHNDYIEYLCEHDDLLLLKILFSKGVNPNVPFPNTIVDNCSKTGTRFSKMYPIIIAAQLGHIALIEILMIHNANVTINDCAVLNVAVNQGQISIVNLLLTHKDILASLTKTPDEILRITCEEAELTTYEASFLSD